MSMRTRSMGTQLKDDFGGETIQYTRDENQVFFVSNPDHLPLWRFVFLERYKGKFRPSGTNCTLKETTQNNKSTLSLPVVLINPLPSELWHSTLQLVFGKRTKLFTCHIYYSTGTVLIQGNVCEEWITKEFEKLKSIVAHLSLLDISRETAVPALDSAAARSYGCTSPSVCEGLTQLMTSDTSIAAVSLLPTATVATPASSQQMESPGSSSPAANSSTSSPAAKDSPASPAMTDSPSTARADDSPSSSAADDSPSSATAEDSPSSATAEDPPSSPAADDSHSSSAADVSHSSSAADDSPSASAANNSPSSAADESPSSSAADDSPSSSTADNSPSFSSDTAEDSPSSPAAEYLPPTNDTAVSPTKPREDPQYQPSSTPCTPLTHPDDGALCKPPHPIPPPISTESPPSPASPSLPMSNQSADSPLCSPTCPHLPTLSQLANMSVITHLHKQLISAAATISTMQQAIHTLTEKLDHATQQIEHNRQSTRDTEVRLKNAIKANNNEMTQKIQELGEENMRLHSKLKDATNKFHSFKDSQSNINVDMKKQLQTISIAKQTRHSCTQTDQAHAVEKTQALDSHAVKPTQVLGNQTDQTHDPSTSSTHLDYAVGTSNRYSVLSDNHDTCSTAHTAQASLNKSKEGRHHSGAVGTPNKQPTPRPSPLTTLSQMTVPESCSMLLLGDSVLAGIDDRQLWTKEHRGKNLSVPGLTIHHVCQWLTARPPSPHIQRITFHVGINSCERGPVSEADWVKLLRLLRRAFPNAVLQASSILPPLGRHPLRQPASQSTASLRRACLQERAVFIDNTPSFLARSGAPRKAMYRDRLHPSELGCSNILHNISRYSNHISRHIRKPPSDSQAMSDHKSDSQAMSDHKVPHNRITTPFDYDQDFPDTMAKHSNPSSLAGPFVSHRPDRQQEKGSKNQTQASGPPIVPPPSLLPFAARLSSSNVSLTPPDATLPPPNTFHHSSPPAYQQHTPTNMQLSQFRAPYAQFPSTTHTPLHAAQTTHPLHPLTVQLLNSLTAQLLSQQQHPPHSVFSMH